MRSFGLGLGKPRSTVGTATGWHNKIGAREHTQQVPAECGLLLARVQKPSIIHHSSRRSLSTAWDAVHAMCRRQVRAPRPGRARSPAASRAGATWGSTRHAMLLHYLVSACRMTDCPTEKCVLAPFPQIAAKCITNKSFSVTRYMTTWWRHFLRLHGLLINTLFGLTTEATRLRVGPTVWWLKHTNTVRTWRYFTIRVWVELRLHAPWISLQTRSTQPWSLNRIPASAGARRECHLCRVAGNTVWSHAACEFP